MYEEPYFLLSKELTSTGNYFSLLKTIAAGDHKIGKIAAKLNTMQSQLTKYLKVLIDMDIVERRVPVTESDPSKSKRGLYYITDNFLEFWFKFVYPRCKYYAGKLSRIQLDKIVSKLRQAEINNSFGADVQKIFAVFSINGFETDAVEFARSNNVLLFSGDCQLVMQNK